MIKTIVFLIIAFLLGILLGKVHQMFAVETVREVEKKRVALTFDDGPNPLYTPTLLEGLRERDVHASFFLLGKEAQQYQELVRQIDAAGHLIGIHSYEHIDLQACGNEKACEQVQKTDAIIYQLTGKHPDYIRPPYGNGCEELEKRFQLLEVLWDVDPKDWDCKDAGTVAKRVTDSVKDGDVILLHDAYASSIQAAFSIIDTLKGEGYEFVTVDELITD